LSLILGERFLIEQVSLEHMTMC